ncbi:MAG: hypothetical protein E7555_06285 [Ruminococcaceae bacterium]|nr:hypothetical protein [Oscillospiraceae bacterium]
MKNIKDYITEELYSDDQKIALDFVDFLYENNLEFIKDNGYWKDKIYHLIKLKDKCVCFIAIKDPDEKENHWTVWSDDMSSDFLNNYQIDNQLKKLAWEHVDLCGHCGSCGGGRRKIIFGKSFDNICGCTFRFDNPDIKCLEVLKEIVKIRISEINSLK